MAKQVVYLITSGDLRESANRICWPAQRAVEDALTTCFGNRGVELRRAAPYDAVRGHEFVGSQR